VETQTWHFQANRTEIARCAEAPSAEQSNPVASFNTRNPQAAETDDTGAE
jgi:hypothetical protein